MNTRPGLYVDGRRYSFECRSQAIARAEFLSIEFGRDVRVEKVDYHGASSIEFMARFDRNSISGSMLMVMGS